jgi:type II secretory pathway pseudopilin PulG
VVNRERGLTVLEVTIALGIVTILLTTAFGGVRAHQLSVARAWSELEASRAASNRLEELRVDAGDLTAGTTSFEPPMRGAEGVQRVRIVEPGLLEIETEVHHPSDHVRVRLSTLLAREAMP